MKSNDAFRPGGRTLAIDAPTAAPPAGVQLEGMNAGDISVLCFNPGPNLVWLAFGNTAADAQSKAVAPVAGAPQYALALPTGSIQTFTFSALNFFSVLAVTGTQTIYLTSGGGI